MESARRTTISNINALSWPLSSRTGRKGIRLNIVKVFISLFIFSAILLPPIHLVSGMPSLRLEILVLLVILERLYSRNLVRLDIKDRISTLFACLFFIACLAIVSSYWLFHTPFNTSDFMILPMLIQYWLIYCFAKSIHDHKLQCFSVQVVAVCVGLAALVGIFQKINLLGINNWLTPHYIYSITRENILDALRDGNSWARVVGTVGDPRHYAYILTMGTAASFSLILYAKTSNRQMYCRQFWWALLVLYFVALILTGSKSGFVAFILVFLIGICLLRFTPTRFSDLFMALSILSIITVYIWTNFSPVVMKERILSRDTDSYEHSLEARIRDFQEPFKLGIKEPLIFMTGRGPSKAILPGSEHSDVGWFTMRYGLLGLACYLLFLYRSLKLSIKKIRSVYCAENQIFGMFSILVIIIWFLFLQAESIFKLPQLMSMNMFVVGLIFASPWPNTCRACHQILLHRYRHYQRRSFKDLRSRC